jgi:hypothetical protein
LNHGWFAVIHLISIRAYHVSDPAT